MSAATEYQVLNTWERPQDDEQQTMVRKVAVSSFMGNFIEWFDYASYSYFATVIATVFFPA